MNSRHSAIAVLALALGTAALGSSEAWARDPVLEEPPAAVAPGDPPPPNQVSPVEPAATSVSSSDDTGQEIAQAGASALGGAGVAFGAMWLYRRHRRLAG